MKKILIVLSIVLIALAVIAGAGTFFLHHRLDPETLAHDVRIIMSEALDTEVDLDRCELSPIGQSLSIYGLRIKDKRKEEMLRIDTVQADVELRDLFSYRLIIKNFSVHGASVNLYRDTLGAVGNWKFAMDSLRVANTRKDESTRKEMEAEAKKSSPKLIVDTRHFELDNVRLRSEVRDLLGDSVKIRHRIKGIFDVTHIDLLLSLKADDIFVEGDSISMRISDFSALERNSQLDIRKVTMLLEKSGQSYHARDVLVMAEESRIDIPSVSGTLASRKKGTRFSMEAPEVRIHAVLKDIANPFAKVLKDFTTPIEGTLSCVGTDSCFIWNDIHLFSEDARFDLKADGSIRFPVMGTKTAIARKYLTSLTFDIHSMHARDGFTRQVLNHFTNLPSSLEAMLAQAGDIGYEGSLEIPYRKEIFKGSVHTAVGRIHIDGVIDGMEKTMSGKVSSSRIDLKRLAGDDFGKVAFEAEFNLNTSVRKSRLALPIGFLRGKALESHYKMITFRDIDFAIVSDGTSGHGAVESKKKVVDVSTEFTFQGTDIRGTLKLKPHIKIHDVIKNTFLGRIFGKKSKE